MRSIKVMTFNLKFATPEPPNSWVQRRPVTAEMIRSVSPDIIGTQEGLYSQIKDIKSDCPEYDWIGLGRDGGSCGEFGAIFYRSDRFEPIEFDHCWLSDTPDVVAFPHMGEHQCSDGDMDSISEPSDRLGVLQHKHSS